MHIECVRFDKVFDVQPHARVFSFSSAGKSRYAVELPGGMVPPEGATYAVALARPDDWSRVPGWREIGTQTVFLPRHTWLVRSVFIELAWWLLCATAIATARMIHPWLLLVLPCALAGLVLQTWRRNRTLRQALLAQS